MRFIDFLNNAYRLLREREKDREREKFSNKRERNLICPTSLARSLSRSLSSSCLVLYFIAS